MLLSIGIDDTDSIKGMCTTYLAAVLKDELERFCKIKELRLVRLNPTIPWKTRGNGSCAVIVETKKDNYEKIVTAAIDFIKEFSVISDANTNPGAVFLKGEAPEELNGFYQKALHSIVSTEEALELAGKHDIETFGLKNRRGIIGALAAVGAELKPRTYEIITYRKRENWGKPRSVDKNSVIEMDRKTKPITFNNIDYEVQRVLITPRSPCPVFFGIRAVKKEVLIDAMKMIRSEEDAERYAVFTTNQGTDAHLEPCTISEVKPFTSVIVEGTVSKQPHVIEGGHVIFTISSACCDMSASQNTDALQASVIHCAAYEPTGKFREIAGSFLKGDVVKAYGSIEPKENLPLTVNLEKLEILKLAEAFEERNPLCKKCGKRMESMGKGQGYRCKKCGEKTEKRENEKIKVQRKLETKIYSVPLRAMRHLSKPLSLEFEEG